jgi:hypothetical protein
MDCRIAHLLQGIRRRGIVLLRCPLYLPRSGISRWVPGFCRTTGRGLDVHRWAILHSGEFFGQLAARKSETEKN